MTCRAEEERSKRSDDCRPPTREVAEKGRLSEITAAQGTNGLEELREGYLEERWIADDEVEARSEPRRSVYVVVLAAREVLEPVVERQEW